MGGGECLDNDLRPEYANQCNVYLWGYTCYVSCNPSQYTTINSTAAIVKHRQRWVRMSVTRRARGRGESAGCWAKYRQQWVESSGAEDRAQHRQEQRPLLPSSCSRWAGAAWGAVKRYTWVWALTLHTTLPQSAGSKIILWKDIYLIYFFLSKHTPIFAGTFLPWMKMLK